MIGEVRRLKPCGQSSRDGPCSAALQSNPPISDPRPLLGTGVYVPDPLENHPFSPQSICKHVSLMERLGNGSSTRNGQEICALNINEP